MNTWKLRKNSEAKEIKVSFFKITFQILELLYLVNLVHSRRTKYCKKNAKEHNGFTPKLQTWSVRAIQKM